MFTSYQHITQPEHGIRCSEKAYPSRNIVHAKLELTTPGDSYEREADRMADFVMRRQYTGIPTEMPSAVSVVHPTISRSVSGSEGVAVDAATEDGINASRGGGQPMPEALRSQMESGFGADFSGVRLHTDSRAADLSQGIQAKAFTYGNDIYFNRGQYSPDTSTGQHLIAHELTHVVQQSGKVGREEESDTQNLSLLDEKLKSKIETICETVKSRLEGYNEEKQKQSTPDISFQPPNIFLIEKAYKLHISTNIKKIIKTNQEIINLLTKLKENINKITINIKDGDKIININKNNEMLVVLCETTSGQGKIHVINCYIKRWEKAPLEEKAFTIIHEFSHMWTNSDDSCYFSVGEKHIKSCTKKEYKANKANTASAIEYYIRYIYRGSPEVNLGERKKAIPNVE